MSEIKTILDTIASISGKNDKRAELLKHSDNELLKEVLYKANSPRVKFWVKQIPEYEQCSWAVFEQNQGTLKWAIDSLDKLSSREISGGDATNFVKMLLSCLSDDDANVLKRIIKKDLKIGMDTGINDVIPNLIEETPYMGAKSFSEKGAKKLFEKGKKVYSQVKMDGTYRNAIIMGGQVELISRQGEVSVLNNATFLEELSNFPDCVLNGELTIDGFERYEANGMVSSIMDILKKEEDRGEKETTKKIADFEIKHGSFADAISKMRYTVWDIITLEEYFEKTSSTPYHERFSKLQDTIIDVRPTMISIVETFIVDSYAKAMDHFLDTQNRGLEGTIIKSADGEWKDGKPTYQIKMKLEMNIDLKIIEFIYGNEGTKNENVISRLKVQSSCGLLTTQPSGMNEAMMKYVTEHQDELMGTIVEVRCCGLSQNERGEWSLLHPSVVELRSDKNTCDSLETATEIQNMAKGLTKLLS